MSVLGDRLRELRGKQSQREMAEAIGIKYQAWDRYEKGKVSPGADILQQICRIHACSADWLLGLPERPNGAVTVNAPVSGAAVAVGNATATVGGDCAKCQLMIEHIRQITGRG